MPLTLTPFPAGENGFFRAPVLLSGATEALLVDGGFTLADGRAVAAAIRDSGKRLTTIYVSQSDPDYYFSLRPIVEAFPEARVLAAPETVAAIAKSVQKKLDAWGPKLGENGPQTLADVVVPTASDTREFFVDGEAVEILDADGLTNRRTVWVPSLRALVGGVLVFSGVHVWTADTQSAEQRAAWIANLDALAARNPSIVIPGHLGETGARPFANASENAGNGVARDGGPETQGAPALTSALTYTRDYLRAFEEELLQAPDSGALIAAMKRRYPLAGMGVALDIGAKVAKGEMVWG